MTRMGWDRWASLSGVAAVIVWIVSFAIGGSTPDSTDSDAKITTYYASHSHQVRQIVAYFVFLAGLLLFFGFLGILRSRLAATEREPGRLASLAYGSGVASIVLWAVGLAVFQAPAFVTNDVGKSALEPNTYRILNDMGYPIWVSAVIVGSVMVWAASAAALRSGIFPRWFAWLGVVAGVVMLFAILFFPVFVYWGWILIASLLLAFRGARDTAAVSTATA